MDIYNKVIRIIFTVVIPITFINYYPIQYLNNTTNNLLYLLCPFAILVFLFISIIVFKAGIKHYYSTGS
jgi:ABC-2 type transport system permease protein